MSTTFREKVLLNKSLVIGGSSSLLAAFGEKRSND